MLISMTRSLLNEECMELILTSFLCFRILQYQIYGVVMNNRSSKYSHLEEIKTLDNYQIYTGCLRFLSTSPFQLKKYFRSSRSSPQHLLDDDTAVQTHQQFDPAF